MMDGIIRRTEADPHYQEAIKASHTPSRAETADAISYAVQHVVGLLKAPATVAYTSPPDGLHERIRLPRGRAKICTMNHIHDQRIRN